MANILRGILVLLAVAAVLNAASFEEKRSSNEDVPSNLAEAASPELADDSPQEESRDSVEDPADLSKAEDEPIGEEMSDDAEESIPAKDEPIDKEMGDDVEENIPAEDEPNDEEMSDDVEENIPENNPEEEKDFAEENDSPEEETSYSLAEDNPEKDPEDEHDFAEDDDSPEEETSDSLAENSPESDSREARRSCVVLRKCGKRSYNAYTWGCCRGKVYRKATRRCCYQRLISVYNWCQPRCGLFVYNPYTQGCCVTRRLRRYKVKNRWVWRWGYVYQTYSRAASKCCYRRVIPRYQVCLPRCGRSYYYPYTQGCCYARRLRRYKIKYRWVRRWQVFYQTYSKATHKCCYQRVIPLTRWCQPRCFRRCAYYGRCSRPYNPYAQICCGGYRYGISRRCCYDWKKKKYYTVSRCSKCIRKG